MKFIKIQGIGFCALAFLFTVLVSTTNLFSGPAELIFLALMIAILGLPHGALDTLFAKNYFHLQGFKRWFAFIIAYISIAAIVLGIWFVLSLNVRSKRILAFFFIAQILLV